MNTKNEPRGICPVCKKDLDFLPWHGKLSSLEMCPRCFIQFGYDDEAGGDEKLREFIYSEWRDEWIKNGRLEKWYPTKELVVKILMRAEMDLLVEMGCHPILSGGTILIPKPEVWQCSEKLFDKKIRILGYEGFILDQDYKLRPSLENIADYSSEQPTLEVVRSFLDKVSDNITHLEIIVDI